MLNCFSDILLTAKQTLQEEVDLATSWRALSTFAFLTFS
jgi:hypothetical protein